MGVARILARGQPDSFYSWPLMPKHALRLTARAERTVRRKAGYGRKLELPKSAKHKDNFAAALRQIAS